MKKNEQWCLLDGSEITLDDQQQGLKDWFSEQRETLEVVCRISDAYSFYEVSPDAVHSLEELGVIFHGVELSVPQFTPNRHQKIERDKAPWYLDQELQRERLIQCLSAWRRRYWDAVNDSLADSLCECASNRLCASLGNLTEENDCRRASFILREIRKRERELLARYARAPVGSAAEILKTILASILSLTSGTSGIPNAVQLLQGYAEKAPDMLREYRQLNVVRQNCRSLMQELRMENPATVDFVLAEAQEV